MNATLCSIRKGVKVAILKFSNATGIYELSMPITELAKYEQGETYSLPDGANLVQPLDNDSIEESVDYPTDEELELLTNPDDQ